MYTNCYAHIANLQNIAKQLNTNAHNLLPYATNKACKVCSNNCFYKQFNNAQLSTVQQVCNNVFVTKYVQQQINTICNIYNVQANAQCVYYIINNKQVQLIYIVIVNTQKQNNTYTITKYK